ncbi:hypothetical protein CCH79_00013089 [Gambusia affinis]|uniref:Uncharacterized protein n=1 Tax=Gambusia affinis TaxID=33528 RepID=A0A315WWM1_GAMAF|nr:hypothetical protein CCH79_00013089 [Gambusia affinis]
MKDTAASGRTLEAVGLQLPDIQRRRSIWGRVPEEGLAKEPQLVVGRVTVAGPGVGAWPWGGRIPSSTLHRDRGFGWGSWSWSSPRGTPRLSELRPWMSGGAVAAAGSGGDKPGKVKCSRRLWLLLGSLALVFLTSLFLSVSLRGGVSFSYLEPPGWEESRRVKLVPSYVGAHRLSPPETPQQKTCACNSCVGDPGVSDWFDENYDPDISPVWTRDNIQLPPDVYYWWVGQYIIITSSSSLTAEPSNPSDEDDMLHLCSCQWMEGEKSNMEERREQTGSRSTSQPFMEDQN